MRLLQEVKMTHRIVIPSGSGELRGLTMSSPAGLPTLAAPASSRIAYAAAHVVPDPWRASADGSDQPLDWDATLALRRRIWSLGLGVAESMDTAQRGMGLDWRMARELATRTLREARSCGGRVVVGVATDQLPPGERDLARIADAYLEQASAIEAAGGEVVLMASRHLAAAARGPEDYRVVYDKVLAGVDRPVILHWLGDVFDPALRGYWGHLDPAEALDGVVDLMTDHASSIDGIKMSLLDAGLERRLRERLAGIARVFTGDDYHYTELIAGDERGHSHALLGAFAVVAPYAAAALARLDDGDVDGFTGLLGPTEDLSRLVFAAPTQFYKVGVAWLSYLQGHQNHFRMLAGLETGRCLGHLGDLVGAADALGLFEDPDLSARRVSTYFAAHGIT